jgi:hypothetical protein
MDDLDKLYQRLVRNIRSGFPELESRLFEVAKIYHEIVPYRTNRRELGLDTNDDYELALLQLLAGTRGLINADAEMQQAMRKELDSPNPDLSAYRAFGTSLVSLAAEPARRVQVSLTPDDTARLSIAETAAALSRAPLNAAAAAARPTESLGARASAVVTASPPHPPGAVSARSHVSGSLAPQSLESQPPTTPLSQRVAELSMPIGRPTPIKTAAGDKCRYCSAALPDNRAVVFCPSCGHNLTVQHCPACNTELETGWKFCITCGRDTR